MLISEAKSLPKIKICGMKHPANITAVAEQAIDFMGFIFYEKSPRYIGHLPEQSLANLPSQLKKVGVFVNQPISFVREQIARYRLDLVQLHGEESPQYCKQITDLPLIKAFAVSETFDFEQLNQYEGHISYFLFDTKGKHKGGNGQTFDWQLLSAYHAQTPFFLSGGLALNHAEQLATLQHPQLYGLDLNSKFEIEAGLKDVTLVGEFVRKLHNRT